MNPKTPKLISPDGKQVIPPSNLRLLLVVHASLTFAAAVVLIVAPELIPSAVGVRIESGARLICYLLAASELSLAVLLWGAQRLSDAKALRTIVLAFIVLHAASGILEIYAWAQGVSAGVWGNIAVRAVVVFLLAYYGLYKMSGRSKRVEKIEGK